MMIRSILATFALAALLTTSCTDSNTTKAETDAKTGAATEAAPPTKPLVQDKDALEAIPKGATVWVNTDSLLTHYDWYKTTKAALQAKGEKMEGELAGRMRRFETEYRGASEKAQSGGLSQSQMQELQGTMMQKQQALQAYKEEQGRKLMEEEKRLSEQLTKTLRTYLRKFAQERGYTYVMGYSEPGQVLYADPKLEVTAAAVEGINKEEIDK
jgi:outer membrane protein